MTLEDFLAAPYDPETLKMHDPAMQELWERWQTAAENGETLRALFLEMGWEWVTPNPPSAGKILPRV